MNLSRRFGAMLSGTVLALVLPLSQAQAEDCVRLNELNHCGIGEARLSLEDDSVRVESSSTTGKEGVAIYTGPITSWSAASFIETDAPESRTSLSSMSQGKVTSSAIIQQWGEGISYGASFAGSGSKATSVSVYSRGVIQAFYIYSDMNPGFFPITRPSLSYLWSPSCRPIGQTYNQCMTVCRRYGTCDYCRYPCGTGYTSPYGGASAYRFELPYTSVTLPDGSVVEGDELVLAEVREEQGPAAPVCDEIRIQTTAQSMTVFGSSVVGTK